MASKRGRAPREAFLSHASADRQTADAIAMTLRAHGVPVWYSTTNIQGAQQWHDEIGLALKRCDWFLLVLSPASIRSLWVKRELLFALNDARYEERIVPLLAAACDWKNLSWTLDALQFVRFDGSFPAGYRTLFALWGLGFDPSRAKPTLPRSSGRRRSRKAKRGK